MWALVTGGAKNLGSKICLALAEKNRNVLVHYHTSKKEAEEVAEKCRTLGVSAETIQGDFSSREGIQAFLKICLESFPETNVLINNVGAYLIQSSLNTSVEEWHGLFHTNLHAPFEIIQALTPALKKSKGNIINIGCVGVESTQADTYSSAYMISKQALLMLTKSVALELAPSGVRVNMLSPGHLEHSVDLPKDLSVIPVGRAAKSDDLTRVVTFLLDEENSYITGQNIDVAGGLRL
jgi:NAD(P)-dependent dehydrogenase (short-subunit alcohol dehydrogenase family)